MYLVPLTSDIIGLGQFCTSCGSSNLRKPLPVEQVVPSWQLPGAEGGAGPSTH